MEKKYTIKELLLACREEYLKQLVELEKLNKLAIPLSPKSDRVKFELSGSVLYSDIICNVMKKITKIDRLLKHTDDKVLTSYNESSCRTIPYVLKDVEKFEAIKSSIKDSGYFKGMNNVAEFKSGPNNYLIQTTVGDIRITRKGNKISRPAGFSFSGGNLMTLDHDTEIADAYNILNAEIPAAAMTEYQRQIIDTVEDPFALRIIDVRKAGEVKQTRGVVVLAKRK
jgi:hypothetical protein